MFFLRHVSSDGANTSLNKYATIWKRNGWRHFSFNYFCCTEYSMAKKSPESLLCLLKGHFLNLLCQTLKFPTANLLLPLLNLRLQPFPPLLRLLSPLLARLIELIKALSIFRDNKPRHL